MLTRKSVSGLFTGIAMAVAPHIYSAPPVAVSQTVTNIQGRPLNIYLQALPQSSNLVFTVYGQTFSGKGKAWLVESNKAVYIPNPGYTGEDAFQFTVANQDGTSEKGTVRIVNPSLQNTNRLDIRKSINGLELRLPESPGKTNYILSSNHPSGPYTLEGATTDGTRKLTDTKSKARFFMFKTE